MKAPLIIAALALAPLATVAAPTELRFRCPERYGSQAAELAELPQGWQPSMATVRPHLLISGGGMVRGSPRLYPPAELRGSEGKTSNGGWSETRFPVQGESWAFCDYGQGGEIRLFRRVDGVGVRDCVIRTRQRASAPAPTVEIVCR